MESQYFIKIELELLRRYETTSKSRLAGKYSFLFVDGRSKYSCYWTEPNKKGKRRDFPTKKSREVQLSVIPLEVESAAGLLLRNRLNAATGGVGRDMCCRAILYH